MTAKTKKAKQTTTKTDRVIVVQTKRGQSRPEDRVLVTHLAVPDLWHAFEGLERVADEIRRDNPTRNVVVDARAQTLEQVRELAEQAWDIACDMKRCLQDTVNPAVSEALGVLDALKAEAGIRKLKPDDIQRAIDALSKALADGQR